MTGKPELALFNFDTDEYRTEILSAIARKRANIATKQDVLFIKLFDIACDLATELDETKDRAMLLSEMFDNTSQNALQYFQGDIYINQHIKDLLKPFVDSSKFV